jgi:hypothetical protein
MTVPSKAASVVAPHEAAVTASAMSKPTIVNPKALSRALPLEAALKRSKSSVHKTKTASVLLADKAASNIALLPPQPSICVLPINP